MKIIAFIVLSFIFLDSANGQVGINTVAPDANSILDIESTDKGFLPPRLTTTQRLALSAGGFSQGMLVYDTDLDVLFVGYGNGQNSTKWYAVNAWKTKFRNSNNSGAATMTTMTDVTVNPGNVGIGTDTPSEKLEVVGGVKAVEFKGNGVFPKGSIIMWSGKTAPNGWALCNGGTVNGFKTPDLRDRFIVSYNAVDSRYSQPGNLSSQGTTAGNTGGLEKVTLSTSQLPIHNHTGSSGGAGGHSHTFSGYAKQTGNICDDDNEISCPHIFDWATGNLTSYVYDHTHTITINGTGGGSSHENRPAYYTLAYIMRVY